MHLSPNNIKAIAEVAADILGHDHQVTRAIRAILIDPDQAAAAWALIEALPDQARKTLAAMVAERMDTTPVSPHRH